MSDLTNHNADIGKKADGDMISRRMAIDALDKRFPATNCSEIPNGSDGTISRQAAIDAAIEAADEWDGGYSLTRAEMIENKLKDLPSAQPEDVVGIINNSIDNALTLLDSIHSSGRMMYYSDYCALHDAISSISVQPDHVADIGKKVEAEDCISRQAAIDALAKFVPYAICDESTESYTNGLKDAYNLILQLPAAPSTAHTTETTAETTASSTDDWVSVKKRLPAVPCCRCLITRDDGRGRATVEEALFSFGRWYSNEWLEDGRNRKFDISTSVIAWAPFPAPYRGGEK